jgi:hypothetical protein
MKAGGKPLKMEAIIYSSETSADFQRATRRHITVKTLFLMMMDLISGNKIGDF